MKRIIALLLIICLTPALFACTNEPETTKTETSETAAETSDAATAETETAASPETDTDNTAETDKPTDTETEPVPEGPAVYGIYDPQNAAKDHTGTLTLYDRSVFKAEQSYTDDAFGVNARVTRVTEGDYSFDDQGVDLELRCAVVTVKYTFDSDAEKEDFLKNIKDQHLYGIIDGEKYENLKNAANGEVRKDTNDVTKAVVDNGTAYYLIPGAALSDNEYYIVENDYTLILNGDGSCRMRSERFEKDEKGFGEYIATDVYEGTYKRSKEKVSAVITRNTSKRAYTDKDNEAAYKQYYEEQYTGGFLGKVYYDYYAALITEGGYTDDDMSDTYIISLEPHTHTAIIIESPDSET